jgi:hypothetical protein
MMSNLSKKNSGKKMHKPFKWGHGVYLGGLIVARLLYVGEYKASDDPYLQRHW